MIPMYISYGFMAHMDYMDCDVRDRLLNLNHSLILVLKYMPINLQSSSVLRTEQCTVQY